MLTDASLFGCSAPSILLLASTVSRSKCYASASFSWQFNNEAKLLSTGHTNSVGAALSTLFYTISSLRSQRMCDAMVWSNILLPVSDSLRSKGSASASFSWQFNSEAKFLTHASVPGCSAPNALLLPATASQSKGSALAALAWQRGQHVDRRQSIWMLSSQHPSSCFHCLAKQVLRLGKFLLAVQ